MAKSKYTVTKKPLTANTIWDAEAGKPLCRFDKGVIDTDDDELANKLKALGHTVTENNDAKRADNPSVDSDKGNYADDNSADSDKNDDQQTDGNADQDSGKNADNAQTDTKATTRKNRSGK